MKFINCWENEMQMGTILTSEFLSLQTFQSLRVTLHSTIDLSMYLLK